MLNGKEVSTGRVLGLQRDGWKWGAGSYVESMHKQLGNKISAELAISGFDVQSPTGQESQTLGEVRLAAPGQGSQPKVGDLTPVQCSELLRDLESLVT